MVTKISGTLLQFNVVREINFSYTLSESYPRLKIILKQTVDVIKGITQIFGKKINFFFTLLT